jgi:hypothetical protein
MNKSLLAGIVTGAGLAVGACFVIPVTLSSLRIMIAAGIIFIFAFIKLCADEIKEAITMERKNI